MFQRDLFGAPQRIDRRVAGKGDSDQFGDSYNNLGKDDAAPKLEF